MNPSVGFLKGRQIVFLSSIDWDSAWQRHHALAKAFSEAGSHVLFLENTGFRNPRLSDAGRIARRLLGLFAGNASRRRTHPLPKGLRILSPLVLPPTHRLFRLANRYWLLPAVARRFRRRDLEDAIVIAYIPSQTTLDLLDLFWPRRVIYDVVDHFGGHPQRPPDLAETESGLLRASDLVFTTSPHLQQLHEKRHPFVSRVHHGVDEGFFLAPPALPSRHARLCYFGTLREDLDYDAVNSLGEAGFRVELIGPVKDPPPPLHPEIRLTGMLSQARLLERLAEQDALLLPYRSSEWNKGITPAKIYECLATGRPVIASAMPGLAELSGLLYTARDSGDFVQTARRLDAEESPERIAERVSEARRHSSSAQFGKIAREITASLSRPRHGAQHKAPVLSLPPALQEILKGLSWITAFFTAAKAATLLSHVAAARLLGPQGYGAANLILAISSLLQIVPMLGFPLALAHFAPIQETDFQRRRLISSIFAAFALWATLFLALAASGALEWTALAGLEPADGRLAALLAFLTAAHLTAASGLQGLTWFRRRGAAEAFYGLSALGLLLGTAAFGFASSRAFVHCLCGGLAAGALYSLYQLRDYLRLELRPPVVRSVAPYAVVGTLSVAASALIHAPGRICLFRFDSAHAAGVYSAYFTATVQIALALLMMIATVLIPLASRPDGQREAWRQLLRRLGAITAASFACFSAFGALALAMIGRSYEFHAGWLLLFAASAAAVLAHGTLAALYAARGLRGLVVSVLGALLAGIGNLVFNLLLTPRWGIGGAAAALLCGYSLGLAWYLFKNSGTREHE